MGSVSNSLRHTALQAEPPSKPLGGGHPLPICYWWISIIWMSGAVERNRTSTGYAHSALNAARLPVPPRPRRLVRPAAGGAHVARPAPPHKGAGAAYAAAARLILPREAGEGDHAVPDQVRYGGGGGS
jgi:hypothetical protein